MDKANGTRSLYYRSLDQRAARPIAGTQEGLAPAFSPDGESIAFFAGGNLKRISIEAGIATNLAQAPNSRGVVWSRDDSV